jgi:tetrapyrrole methylase family protein / MazG family protein
VPDRVVALGLGPAGADHVLPVARSVLASSSHRFARTLRHPAVDDLVADGITFTSFDDVYDAAPDLESAYAEIATRLVAAAH